MIENFYKSYWIAYRYESRNLFTCNMKHIVIKKAGKSLTLLYPRFLNWWYRYKSLKHQKKLKAHVLISSQVTSSLNIFGRLVSLSP